MHFSHNLIIMSVSHSRNWERESCSENEEIDHELRNPSSLTLPSTTTKSSIKCADLPFFLCFGVYSRKKKLDEIMIFNKGFYLTLKAVNALFSLSLLCVCAYCSLTRSFQGDGSRFCLFSSFASQQSARYLALNPFRFQFQLIKKSCQCHTKFLSLFFSVFSQIIL